eukprot:803229-Heterocapsa_arctica.AAC.1
MCIRDSVLSRNQLIHALKCPCHGLHKFVRFRLQACYAFRGNTRADQSDLPSVSPDHSTDDGWPYATHCVLLANPTVSMVDGFKYVVAVSLEEQAGHGQVSPL